MNSNITIAQARAIYESASAAAEASVVARFGECDILNLKHGAAYDAALLPLLEEHFGDMTMAELLGLFG
jgi:hypothetical protein